MKRKDIQNNELSTDKVHIVSVIKRTLKQKEADYSRVIMWYENEYDSSTPSDGITSMDIEAAGLNAQIKVLRHILSEVGEL